MTLYLVSKKGRKKFFSSVKKISHIDGAVGLETVAPGKLAEVRELADDESFFFLDAGAFGDGELWNVLEGLSRTCPGRVGVFDPDGDVTDPAQVFFCGGVDYLSPAILSGVVSKKRLMQIPIFRIPEQWDQREHKNDEIDEHRHIVVPAPPPKELPSGRDWSAVRSGVEYTFWFLFAQLDDTGRLAVRTSSEYASQTDTRFRDRLLAEAGRFGGRIWMWKQFGGLLLFPYDGKRCMPIVPAFRLFMNRVLYTVERTTGTNVLSFRLAIHLGNTVYREAGETGDVVSEDVNFVYHLGNKHTGPGDLTMTSTAFSFVPAGLQRYFTERGTFEGHRTMGMSRFVPGALTE